LTVCDLRAEHFDAVTRIDASHTVRSNPDYWRGIFDRLLREAGGPQRVGLAVEDDEELIGYLVGEVRAFEFGSEACGWIFAVAVDPNCVRGGVATALTTEACARFRIVGVSTVRTMVRRTDVAVLSFFRAQEFVGGSFVELELDLEEHG
jgi:ribosomal protein S18 acetylase RimI-like enzyme